MTYYIFQQDPRVPEQPSILECPDDIEPDQWLDGKVMDVPRDPLRLKMSPRSGSFRGVLIRGVLTLFHDVLREELNRQGVDNIQYFNVELENPEGVIETKYSLINILGLLDAVDQKNSVIEERFGGKGRGRLRSFKIDPAAVHGQKIFRILHNPTLIIVDQALQSALSEINTAGAWMIPTEDFEGY